MRHLPPIVFKKLVAHDELTDGHGMKSAATIQINGETTTLPDSGALVDVLRAHGIDPSAARGVAVAVNERIVRRGDWIGKTLSSGDEVEIVTARQGG